MRVALVIERFEPGAGGVEAVAWNVASALARRGVEVHVVARRAAPCDAVVPHRVSVPTFWQPLRVLAFSRAAARAAAAGGFDVVHAFSRTRHQDVFRAGGGSHADYLERVHGIGGGSGFGAVSGIGVGSGFGAVSGFGGFWRRSSPRHAVLLAMERRVFADPGQIIQCNSAMVQAEIARRYGVPAERLVVIPNGVDLARFHPERRAEGGRALRAELGAETAAPVWLLAGSGFRRKGLDVALRALALAGGSGVLWVAGRDAPGPFERLARALGVADRVRFLGLRDDLPDVYAAADALLLPTRYDAFANVCLEALASGLPVVTSSANGAADTVGEAGFVIEDPEDAAGFAKALETLADPEARAARASAARPIAERHGWDAHAAALLALYARVRR